MMNVLALSLVLTTLLTAGVFSPSPEKPNQKDDVILKEGHRTVVVEYEKDDRGNTRISISPDQEGQGPRSSEVDGKSYASRIKDKISDEVENAKENLKEVVSDHLPNLGEGTSASKKDEDCHGHWVSPRELVCDAYGKCKHKIASAFGKTKDKVYEKANEAAEKVYEVEEEVKEDVKEALNKVKETVREKSHGVSEKASEAKERVKDGASEIYDKAKEAVKEGAKEKAEKVKRGAVEVVDTSKTLKGDVEDNVSRMMENTLKKESEKAQEAEGTLERTSQEVKDAHKLKEEGKKDLKEILRRGREVAYDAFSYVVSPNNITASVGVLQLLGFATAYGTSIWMTFISSYVLARAMPRRQFAMVQSKIYPVYFKTMACSIVVVLIGHLFSQRERLSSRSAETFQSYNLVVSLIAVLANMLILDGWATKVMLEKMKMEKEEGKGKESNSTTAEPSARIIDSMIEPAITRAAESPQEQPQTDEKPEDSESKTELIRIIKKLGKLNAASSYLNILSLMNLTWHLVYLARRICCVSGV